MVVNAAVQVVGAISTGDPVPWARSQMAFTLAFHIILVPLGVSWAFMTLIANYRALKHDDADALLLAQRWSKYMAVTFAVGAVTGTVLSFEFGLLWPKFMGQWGEAFGVPFAFEGIFFFTEAIFVAIYIYGWRRMRPWAHFWTGVPIVLAGILGAVSVVAANSWMNAPSGFTLDSSGKVVDVDPVEVIFNKAMPLESAHMLVAAYLVGGFLIASVYADGLLRGRRDRYHRLGFVIAVHRRRDRDAGPDGRRRRVGAVRLRRPAGQVRGDRARPADVERRPRDAAGSAELQRHGRAAGSRSPASPPGCPIPAPASPPSCKGSNCVPAADRPTIREVNIVHLAWDVMVGLGTPCSCCPSGTAPAGRSAGGCSPTGCS